MLFEIQSHPPDSCWFLTLTYAPEHIPPDGSVQKRDVQLYMKRLRKNLGTPVRYYFVGEYGTHTHRPHYHACIFGVQNPQALSTAWQQGHVHVRRLDEAAIKYTVGYIMKGATTNGHPALDGKEPEFALMSRRPGLGENGARAIGSGYAARFADELRDRGNFADIPSSVLVGKTRYYLGRYSRSKSREAAGLSPDLTDEVRWAAYEQHEQRIKEAGGIDAFQKHRDNNRKVAELQANARFRLKSIKEKL